MLTFEKIILKSSRMGEESIIPDIHNTSADPFFIKEESITEADNLKIGQGMISTILPYKMQKTYTREVYDIEYTAAVLENEHLKAVFLPGLGGRLWSLYDKDMKRDIVYKNDAVRFGNLALRNAWCAGGVEWNIGIKGHSPITCDPMFAQRVKTESGEDALKMYAYEEIRNVVYSIMALLRGNELVVRVNIENLNDNDTYMYWWSNIAVEQNDDTRFFAPTDKSFVTAYREGGYRISKKSIPMIDGKDISHPYNAYDAIDYFYDIPENNKKWISSLDKQGKGLLQFSTPELVGRKCFLWGNLPGGKHWNEWLTGGRDYLEIQAGLMKTQFEHFIMPKNSEITWCEVYKGVDIGTNEGDYFDLVEKIDSNVYNPAELLNLFKHQPSDKVEFMGTPRGALEEAIRGKRISKYCIFPKESITDDYKYYTDLLQGIEGSDYNIEYLANSKWAQLIDKKPRKTALDYYLIGINHFINGDVDKAEEAFNNSLAIERTYYTLIAMALIKANLRNSLSEAVSLAAEAIIKNPEYLPLACCFAELSIKANMPQEFLDYYSTACEKVKQDGRIKMYVGNCLILCNRLKEAKEYINADLVIPDIREGEYSISNFWIDLYRREMAENSGRALEDISDSEVLEKHPIPYNIDFRMH